MRVVAAFSLSLMPLLAVGVARAEPTTRAEPEPKPTVAETPRREPSAGDLATARAALVEGLALRGKGDIPAALARLTTAWELVETPVTGFELGKTFMMSGRILEAHELFKKIERMPLGVEESSRSEAARDEAVRLSKALEPRIPSLRIKLILPEGARAALTIDDEPIDVLGEVTPRAVEPGEHEVTARAGDGPATSVTTSVGEGETREVVLAPQWIPPRPKPPGGDKVVVVRQTNPMVFVGFGVASAGLVIASFSTLMAVNAADRAKARCGIDYCPQHVRDDEIFEMNAWIVTTAVGGAIAAVFTGVGIAALSRPVEQRVTASLRPVVGWGRIGLEGRF